MTWLGLLLTLAITLRMTRLITKDSISQPFRSWATARSEKFGLFVHCPWCVGWWIAVATAIASHWWAYDWEWQVFAGACAASWLTGMAALWLDEE